MPDANRDPNMWKHRPGQRRVLGGLVCAATIGLLAVALFVSTSPSTESPGAPLSRQPTALLQEQDAPRVPDFTLIERNGRQITLADLRGRVWIADFIWTRCPDACPLMSAVMARLQAEFAEEPDLRLVSFSVDPQYDTPTVLASYAAKFDADRDRWLFLTGEKQVVYHLVQQGFKLLVYDPDDAKTSRGPGTPPASPLRQGWFAPPVAWAHGVGKHRENPVIHSDRFVLVDRNGRIRGYYLSTDTNSLEQLKRDATGLLRAGRL